MSALPCADRCPARNDDAETIARLTGNAVRSVRVGMGMTPIFVPPFVARTYPCVICGHEYGSSLAAVACCPDHDDG